MVTTFYPPFNFGGDGRSTQRLANALAERGHRVDIIHLPGIYRLLAGAEPTAGYNDHPDIHIHAVETRHESLSLLMTHQTGMPFAKSSAIRKILAGGFDVIHYHNISLFGPDVLGYGQAAAKIYTFHEYWLICPTHVLYRYNRTACDNPRLCQICTLVQGRPPQLWRYTGLLRKALRNVDAFISPSEFTMRRHLEAGLDIPIVRIPNFVSDFADEDSTERPPEVDSSPYFLYVGNLNRVKGLHRLIAVFEHYRRAKLVVVIEGSPRPELEQHVAESDHIRFIRDYSDRTLGLLYRHATALLVPSLGYEISSQVIMEAAARRTPVIARNIGSIAEFVNSSGAGLTYEEDGELPAMLDRMLDDEAYRSAFGERGHQTYRNEWTADIYIQRYLALIDSIRSGREDNRQGNSN